MEVERRARNHYDFQSTRGKCQQGAIDSKGSITNSLDPLDQNNRAVVLISRRFVSLMS